MTDHNETSVLLARIEQLEARLAALEPQGAPSAANGDGNPGPISRRALLAKIGGAAVAGAGLAAAGSTIGASPAAAAANLTGDGGATDDGVEGKTSATGRSGVFAHNDSSNLANSPGWGVFGSAGGNSTRAAPSAAVLGTSRTLDAVVGLSDAKTGVRGSSSALGQHGVFGTTLASQGTGVFGATNGRSLLRTLDEHAGVMGDSDVGYGVLGFSGSFPGVGGYASTGYGVYGDGARGGGFLGKNGPGVHASTTSPGESGVFGYVDTSSGVGVAGATQTGSSLLGGSTSAGVTGSSSNAPGVIGASDSSYGVEARSATEDALKATTSASGRAGVFGVNTHASGGWGLFGSRGGASTHVIPPAATVGTSNGSTGVIGASDSGVGVDGRSTSNDGVTGTTVASGRSGVYGVNTHASGGWGLYGVRGSSSSHAIAPAATVGTSIGSIGVVGASNTQAGVYGVTASSGGAAVHANNTGGGYGVLAVSTSGYGLSASSSTGVGVFASGAIPLQLSPGFSAGAPTGTHVRGEIYLDSIGDLYVCTANGTWQKVAYGTASGGGGGGFTPIDPVRIVDTRNPEPPNPPGEHKLTQGEELVVAIRGVAGVPSTATAVTVNITAVAPTATGYMSLYPANLTFSSASPPPFSNVNFVAGDIVANLGTIKIATTGANTGAIKVFNTFGSTHVILDVAGYFS